MYTGDVNRPKARHIKALRGIKIKNVYMAKRGFKKGVYILVKKRRET